ncbi:MAG: DUF2953 domain-containing protein [Lachnospiraceae bacterium]|nr:DUF2953 domain-containing protein [Lachnospiraceae bacterium]
MLPVILTILKIIGIVLLALVIFVLASVIVALVYPFTYRLKAVKTEGGKLTAMFRLSYFLGIFRLLARYEDCLTVKFKIFCFTMFSVKIPDKDDGDSDEEIDLSELDEAIEEEFAAKEKPDADTSEEDANGPEEDTDNDSDHDSDDGSDLIEEDSADTEEESDEEEDSVFDKIKFKFSEIYDKIDKVRSEIRYYYNIYNSNEGKNALYVLKKRLIRILKKILPRKVSANFRFGFDSPDLTGKAYGIYCMISDRFTKGSEVTPDFENKVFEGKVVAKGYFNLWGILFNAACIVLNRNVLKIIKSVKKHSHKKTEEISEETEKAA